MTRSDRRPTGAPRPRPLDPDGALGRFTDDLLTRDLPHLPATARADTVAFVCRRAGVLPAPLRAGVTVLSSLAGLGRRIAGRDRVTTFLTTTRLPFVGELARLARALAVAYVWETWPMTSPTGAQPVPA